MTSKDEYVLKMTAEQKDLFEKWLNQVEEGLTKQLSDVKSLKSQISDTSKSFNSVSKSAVEDAPSKTWTSMLLDALNQLGGAQTSTQIVTWFMENDLALKEKGKRYITKNVTSKLALLVEKGRVEKKVMGGKNVYALKD